MALQWPRWWRTAPDSEAARTAGERVLSQEEIDNLLGFSVGEVNLDDHFRHSRHHRSAMVSYERPAGCSKSFRPPGAVDDDLVAQLHERQRRGVARPHTSVRLAIT